jgi:HAD superfamily hydrolase (TIGR01509 family)
MRPCAQAVLFDLDGLLLDSEPVWYAVESEVVERLGGVWGEHHQAACIGGTLDASCRYILDLTGSAMTVADLTDMLLAGMVEHFHAGLPLHGGALGLVDSVRARGVPTALVSSSYRVLVDAALDRIGRDWFDVVVVGDEISHGKPHPEPYLTACSKLSVDPRKCVVLEDARAGVQSAEAAGCVVVAVPSVAPIPASAGRVVLDALTDIDIEWLLALPCS